MNRVLSVVVLIFTCMAWGSVSIAQPCYSGYDYRVPVILDNALNAGMDNQQVEIVFNSSTLVNSSKMNSDGSDIRILDNKGNPLDFWIEDGTMNSSNTSLWVKTDSIVGYAKDTLYLFYGKSSSTNLSNSGAAFDFFDDFSGTSLGTGWSTCGAGTVSVSGGKVSLTSTATNDITLESTTAFDVAYIIEAKVTSHTGGKSIVSTLNTSSEGYGAILDGSSMGLHEVDQSSGCYTSTAFGTGSTTSNINGIWSFSWPTIGKQEFTWPGGSRSGTNTSTTLSSTANVLLGQSGGGTLEIDWIRVRRYASGLPTITLGSEVSMNYTIKPSYEAPLCEDGDLKLKVDTVVGATYRWTGPNGFTSNLQNPVVTSVKTSDAGLYIAFVEIPSSCASKTSTVNVTISAKAKGGSVSGSQTVCGGSNIGVLSLTGHTGNVERWDSASSPNGPWFPITSNKLNQTYLNLVSTTYYRAIVVNGNCSRDSSAIGTITVTPPSKGGITSGIDTFCAGSNAGTVNLSGYTGDITRWEFSTNGFLWSNIVNRSDVHAYSNLTQTTYFRAVVKNGLCDEETSTAVEISIDKASVGGSATGAATVCEGANSGTVGLTGETGDVIRWEYSYTGSNPWTAIASQTKTLSYTNLSNTIYYRAVVQNGKCSFANSSPVTITIIPKSNGGTISGGTTVCEGVNSGTLTLTGFTGVINKWQYRDKNTFGWVDISTSSTFLSWSSLSDTTYYRAEVSNGTCASASSNTATIAVNPATQSGYLSGTNSVCEGTNSGVILLNSHNGSVVAWESSTTGFSPWYTISNTSDNLSFNNIGTSTFYRARVKNGVCASTNTTAYKVEVSKKSWGGKSGPNVSVCEGSNFGLINLQDEVGDVIKWQYTEVIANGWNDVANFTNRQEYRDLSETTYFRAVVKNGECIESNSNITIVEVDELTEIGEIVGDTAFCNPVNSGVVKLKNYTGDILRWESSTNGRSAWTDIPVVEDSINIKDLTQTTFYRALIKNGSCSQENSLVAVVEVNTPSDAGNVLVSQPEACEDNNFGVLNLSKPNGSVEKWQHIGVSDADWTDVLNTSPQEFYYNLNETTRYRTIVSNGNCPADTSNEVTIKVYTNSVGGVLPTDLDACAGVSKGNIVLKSYNGKIDHWEFSNSSIGPWSLLSSTNDTISYDGLSNDRYYRAIVQNGVCAKSVSNLSYIKVYEQSKAGTLVGGGNICEGGNSGTVVLTNNTGGVQDWEQAPTVVGPWVSLNTNNDSYNFLNLKARRYFRVIVRNGICPNDTSNLVQYNINSSPVVDFSVSDSCYGSLADFTDLSGIVNGNIEEYLWNVSDGYVSNKQSFSKAFPFPGEFTITLQVKSDSGCLSSKSRTIDVLDGPIANFRFEDDLGNGAICEKDSLTLIDISQYDGTGTTMPFWDFGDGTTSTDLTPTKTYATSGTYQVKLVAASPFGCKDSLQRYVTVFKKENVSAGADGVVSKGIPFKLVGQGALVYEWSPEQYLNNSNITSPVGTIYDAQQFVLKGIDVNGCVSYDTVKFDVVSDFKIVPNNVITPEGNGDNDVWIIKNLDTYSDNEVFVFDRWGRQVFSAKNYKNDWAATNIDGSLLTDGTYYYVIQFTGNDQVYKGAITVIRNQ